MSNLLAPFVDVLCASPRAKAWLGLLLARLRQSWRRAQAPIWRRRHLGKGAVVERSMHVLSWSHVKIGRGSIIGASALVTGDVAPLSIVIGNPGRTIKWYSFHRKSWADIGDFTELDERAIPQLDDYLGQLWANAKDFNPPRAAAGYRRGNLK